MNRFAKLLILALVAMAGTVAAFEDWDEVPSAASVERSLGKRRKNKPNPIRRVNKPSPKRLDPLKAKEAVKKAVNKKTSGLRKGGKKGQRKPKRKPSFNIGGWKKSKWAAKLQESESEKKNRCNREKKNKKDARKKRKAGKGLKKRRQKNRRKENKKMEGLEIVGGNCYSDHYCATVRGDPHLVTYDGKKFDCQGHGEFVLAKSLETAFEIQGRFTRTKRTDKSVSITTAISIDTGVDEAPQIDLFTEMVDGTCIINYYVNGVLVDGFGQDGLDYDGVQYDPDILVGKELMDYLYFKDSGLGYSVFAKNGMFGCVLNSKICIHPKMAQEQTIVGLLGTPNGKDDDEWVSAYGTTIPYGESTKWASAYDYCTREHCVHTEDESIFGYEQGTEWLDFYGCQDSYDSGAEDAVENASQECVDCCSGIEDEDGNDACILECVEGEAEGDTSQASCLAELATEESFAVADKKCPDTRSGTPRSAPKKEKEPAPSDGTDSTDGTDGTDDGSDAGTKTGGGFAQNTCAAADWVPQDNTDSPTGMVRCCAGQHGKDGKEYGKCDTSSCPNNFNAKNRNCFNYGAPQNGKNAKDNAGSELCPFADSDHAICDTSFYDNLNGVSCRENPNGKNFQVHCLGKVKCNTKGVTVPKNGHSDGTADYDDSGETECVGAAAGFKAGDDCFYNGASENWKVCDPDVPEEETPEETPEEETPDESSEEPDEPEPSESEEETPPAPDEPTPEDITRKEAFTKGDPHFKTFGGELYDYHGECDLVLLHNPDFNQGMGMDIHIRTKIEAFWSSVESAAIKLGSEVMEIKADPESKEWLWFNGQEVTSALNEGEWNAREISGFKVRFKETNNNVREANIYLKGSQANEVLVMKTFKSFVRIDVNWQGSTHYTNSVGLLGDHAHEGKRNGRDGQFIKNVNAFGQEWQVQPEVDGSLFHSYDGAIVGKKCVMPPTYHKGDNISAAVHRRLGASALDDEQAEKACNHLVDTEEKKACVYDVIATQDLNMASAW